MCRLLISSISFFVILSTVMLYPLGIYFSHRPCRGFPLFLLLELQLQYLLRCQGIDAQVPIMVCPALRTLPVSSIILVFRAHLPGVITRGLAVQVPCSGVS